MSPGTATGTGRPLEQGLLINSLGIIIKVSRTVYLLLFSRFLGAEGFGIYLLAFAIQEFISKFAILGLNWGGKQIIGSMLAQGDEHNIRPTVIRILWITFLFSSLLACAMIQSVDWLASLAGHKSLAGPLRIFATGIPFLTGMYVLVYSFRPKLNMKYEMYITSIIEPMSVLLIGTAILVELRNVEALAYAHVAASVIAFIAAVYFFNRIYPATDRPGKVSIHWKTLVRSSTAMGSMELISNLQSKIDLLLLTMYFPPQIIGVYGAATQIAALLRSVKSAFDPILMPIAQSLHLRSNQERLQREVTRAISWAITIGLGLLGLMVLMPDQLLGLFGSEFSGDEFSRVLIILAVGQFFYMSLGLSEGILAITGHAWVTLIGVIVLVVTEIALLLLLIPVWGATGAALAASVPFVVVSLWRITQTKRLLHIKILTKPQAGIFVVWAGCLSFSLLLPVISSEKTETSIAISALVFFASYSIITKHLKNYRLPI